MEEVVSLYGKLLSFFCSGSKTALKKIVYELKKKRIKIFKQPTYKHRKLQITFLASLEKLVLLVPAPIRWRRTWLDLTWGLSSPGCLTAFYM